MKTKLLIAATLLMLALPFASNAETDSAAYEVALADIRLPRNENGTIAFKACGECDYKTKRVSAQTDYMIDGRSVPLAKFKAAVARVDDRNNEAVAILHHLESDQVTKVSVYL